MDGMQTRILFDDLLVRRALSDHSMQYFAPTSDFTRLLQKGNTTQCFCLKEAKEWGGISGRILQNLQGGD